MPRRTPSRSQPALGSEPNSTVSTATPSLLWWYQLDSDP
jgi:hypothetical protein